MERLGLTQFTLKNTTWRDMNGNRQLTQRIHSQDKRHGMQTVANMLAECSSRSLENYDQHIIGRIKTSNAFKQIMQFKNRRRWKFESYQKGQRAVHKLAADVLNGIENKKDVIVAWGDGSFKPTSSGHASAPNKKLMLSLASFMTIVLVDEHGTTKNSCCCMEKALERKTHGLRAR